MVINPLRRKPLGEILLEQGKLTEEQFMHVLQEQKESGGRVGEIMTGLGYVRQTDILKALAFQKGLTYVDLADMEINPDFKKLVPEEVMRRFKAIPIDNSEMSATFAMSDPTDFVAIEEIEKVLRKKIITVLASEVEINRHIDNFYEGLSGLSDLTEAVNLEIRDDDEDLAALDDGDYAAEDTPIVQYVNSLIAEAVKNGASDIHLEPQEEAISLRLRVDGKLREFPGPAKRAYSAIVSRLKIVSNLDIAERRFPQDGKIQVLLDGEKINLRVSTLPTVYGEKVVMRILSMASISLGLEELGFTEQELDTYKRNLKNPLGMILVTGPTGSGKTTTLYGGLNYINVPDKNIITIEDPVEYQIKNLNQVQVQSEIDLSFSRFLRAAMRQDPDVIMIGEIRDQETASISVQAALTGHLVLSTLHTNDAVSTITRIKYLGINSFLIADAVNLIMAQRLVRRICTNCKQEAQVQPEVLKRLGVPDGVKVYEGRGCTNCFETGYRGRVGIYEILELGDDLKEMIVANVDDLRIKEKAILGGMKTLRMSAVEKLMQGLTTVEEVLTATFH
ncbi:MAG: Flp pilus assembly complex ATPase component TadA [Elusimicrobia bacterium]|nr:Flp pilus assembly complex ATPase component TadA [Elusimicrobiota bacterium]